MKFSLIWRPSYIFLALDTFYRLIFSFYFSTFPVCSLLFVLQIEFFNGYLISFQFLTFSSSSYLSLKKVCLSFKKFRHHFTLFLFKNPQFYCWKCDTIPFCCKKRKNKIIFEIFRKSLEKRQKEHIFEFIGVKFLRRALFSKKLCLVGEKP